ncbi:MAG TPA: hypothetical protein VFB21_08915 [Chthonomonadaceae bacterium]|nr:hypothetical protein [Chthonomonadaceae bacterium]
MKVALAVIVPLVIIVGAVYGLAKVGVVPVSKLAQKNKALGTALKAVGLYHPLKPAAPKVTLTAAADPLAEEKKALEAQKAALAKERADFEAQRAAQKRGDSASPSGSGLDPKNVARLAAVYEQMPPEAVTRIFAKLPANQVLAIVRRMDEKQVGQILMLLPPERAAQMTQALSQPVPPERAAASTP